MKFSNGIERNLAMTFSVLCVAQRNQSTEILVTKL